MTAAARHANDTIRRCLTDRQGSRTHWTLGRLAGPGTDPGELLRMAGETSALIGLPLRRDDMTSSVWLGARDGQWQIEHIVQGGQLHVSRTAADPGRALDTLNDVAQTAVRRGWTPRSPDGSLRRLDMQELYAAINRSYRRGAAVTASRCPSLRA